MSLEILLAANFFLSYIVDRVVSSSFIIDRNRKEQIHAAVVESHLQNITV